MSGLKVHERFIAWEPGRLWSFTVTDMTRAFARSMVERARFSERADGGTDIVYRIAAQPRWWAVPLRRFLGGQMKKSFAQSFGQLESYLYTLRSQN